ncbi:hypothetical protein TNIN_352691 [Trichonephila inaurata madagascariensis]|uniref:Uncharacterized protein n=1 Tax=Trichonephila inaurata madagascariensis TaxID=2747483 RepID=A0A8X6XZY9_9ARAC|nr:hypothetical protein TNIN_352691 [Trichonephila inaurata madagascariensis]
MLIHLTLLKISSYGKKALRSKLVPCMGRILEVNQGKLVEKITYFYCHRNGFIFEMIRREMKIAGSSKINGKLPSKMKVCEDIESKVTVNSTKTHVGQRDRFGTNENN